EVDAGSGSGRAQSIDPEAFESVLERGTIALAAEMVGTARRLFDMTLAYAKERVQFDVPIGSFQALQHKLADMALDLERATSAVAYSAMAVDAKDADRHRAAHVAKAAAGAAATRAAKDGIQIHGGIGYTWEHDLHLFIRHAYGSEAWMGTGAWHPDRLAALVFGGSGPRLRQRFGDEGVGRFGPRGVAGAIGMEEVGAEHVAGPELLVGEFCDRDLDDVVVTSRHSSVGAVELAAPA